MSKFDPYNDSPIRLSAGEFKLVVEAMRPDPVIIKLHIPTDDVQTTGVLTHEGAGDS